MARPTVIIELELEEEDQDPEDSFDDPETLAWVRREIERGNPYAWFVAKVTARLYAGGKREPWNHRLFEGTTYLGGCSYESREIFLQRDGPQLQRDALEELRSKLSEDGPLSKPVALALAEAYFDVDIYERGLRIVDDAPAAPVFALLESLGVPCYLEGDKGACRVLLDAFMDRGLLTDAPSFDQEYMRTVRRSPTVRQRVPPRR
jgi:hypothetical protein